MKKVIISMLMTLLAVTSVSAVSYRGFVELGPDLAKANADPSLAFHWSTTHGVQLNSHFFVGVGAVGSYASLTLTNPIDNHNTSCDYEYAGVYGTVRYDLNLHKKCSPYIGVDLGGRVYQYLEYDESKYQYDVTGNISKFLFNLNFGVRLRTSRRTALSFGFKYTPFKVIGEKYDKIYSGEYYISDVKPYSMSAYQMAVSLGFEF